MARKIYVNLKVPVDLFPVLEKMVIEASETNKPDGLTAKEEMDRMSVQSWITQGFDVWQ